MLTNLYYFAVSFVIALLIGIERERSHPEGRQAIGVRTFILIGLLGTFTAIINAVIFIFDMANHSYGINRFC